MLDHFGMSLFGYKPVSIITYSPGPWGGRHAAIALLPVVHELGAFAVHNMVGIAQPGQHIDENGEPIGETDVVRRFGSQTSQLEWLTAALKKQRESAGVPS